MFKVTVDDDLLVEMDIHGNALEMLKALAFAVHSVEHAIAIEYGGDIKLMHALMLGYYKKACNMKVEEV